MNDNFISDLTSLQFAATVATVVNLSVTNELVTNRKYIYIVYIIYKKGKKYILQALRLLCDFVWV